jgi:hypothetical protein
MLVQAAAPASCGGGGGGGGGGGETLCGGAGALDAAGAVSSSTGFDCSSSAIYGRFVVASVGARVCVQSRAGRRT